MGASYRPENPFATPDRAFRPENPFASPQGARDYHAEYKSGALQRGIKRANQGDQEVAAAEDEANAPTVAGGLANLAHGIPGAEALQAGARSVVRGQSYKDAYQDIEQSRSNLPAAGRAITEIAGSAPLAMLPGGPVAAGAAYGAADQALSADPDRGVGERAVRAVGGGIAGGVLGKVGETLATGARALFTKAPASNLIAKQADRAASAKRLYGAALKEGQGQTGTTAIQRFLDEPDIAEIVQELGQTRPFQGVAHNSPEMLDAVYKTLSDRSATIKKGLESISPNKPNIGRYRGEDVKAAQGEALDVMSGGTSMPGPMPTYRVAVADFAKKSSEMDALRKGYDVLRWKASGNMPTGKNLTRNTPEALAEWGSKASRSPEELRGATQGVLGGVKDAVAAAPFTKGRKALMAAPGLLRGAGAPNQLAIDRLIKAGLLTATQ